jgi:hypothetical protein
MLLDRCPDIFKTSPDFIALALLADQELEPAEFYAKEFTTLHSSKHCPKNLLPHLATQRGYGYNHGNPSYFNRIVLNYFNKDMINNRGSRTGIMYAAATELAALDHPSTGGDALYYAGLVSVLSDVKTGVISILYFLGRDSDDTYPNYPLHRNEDGIPKDQGLVEYVRPVGMYVDRLPAQLIDSNSYTGVLEQIEFRQEDFKRIRRSLLDQTTQTSSLRGHQENSGMQPLDSDNNTLNEAALPDELGVRGLAAAEAARVARPRAALYRMLLTQKSPLKVDDLNLPNVYHVSTTSEAVDHEETLSTSGTTPGEGYLIYDDGLLASYMQDPTKIPPELAFLYDAIFPQDD